VCKPKRDVIQAAIVWFKKKFPVSLASLGWLGNYYCKEHGRRNFLPGSACSTCYPSNLPIIIRKQKFLRNAKFTERIVLFGRKRLFSMWPTRHKRVRFTPVAAWKRTTFRAVQSIAFSWLNVCAAMRRVPAANVPQRSFQMVH